jgi:hypothetical protein
MEQSLLASPTPQRGHHRLQPRGDGPNSAIGQQCSRHYFHSPEQCKDCSQPLISPEVRPPSLHQLATARINLADPCSLT